VIANSIHLLAIIVLLGTGLALRLIVFPIASDLSAEEATRFRGEVMLRARPVFWFSLIATWITGLYLVPWHELGSPGVIHLKLVLSIALTIIASLIAVSPHKRLWLKLRSHQHALVDALLAIGALIILLSPYLTGL
jgi:hypothetical protein